MSIADMHNKFRVSYDAMDTAMAPELTPEAIDVLFNEAQDDLINDITNSGIERTQTNTDYLSKLVKTVEISSFSNGTKPNGKLATLPVDYRKTLLERAEIKYPSCKIVKNGSIENGKEYVVMNGSIVYSGTSYKRGDKFMGTNINSFSGNGEVRSLELDIIKVKPETRDRYLSVINNPFKTPDEKQIIRLSNGNNQNEIILSEFVFLNKYILDYIKEPVKMRYGSAYSIPSTDVDCELNQEAQNKIVQKALTKASKILKQEQYQIFKQEDILNTVN
jgi:hypothetical protein